MINFKEETFVVNSCNCMLKIHHTNKGKKFKSIWFVLLINFLLSNIFNAFISTFYVYVY